MDDFQERLEKLSPKRLQLLALDLHEQVEALRERSREPIALVGVGCRFPGGADDPAAFWKLLDEGRDAIRDVPPDRWDIDGLFDPDPDAPGRISVRGGGFLGDVSRFDPAFFGISPREALTMDPQQRLLLEVSWEALEHAGIAPERLAGSDAGVYVGVCNSDHFQRVLDRGTEQIDAYLASGNAHSVAAGRISYFMGLQGPAIAVDTACSSSLVALHLAVQGLRSGATRLALAAGVNVMCSAETTMALTKAHMLAPDGRCKTFDAAADGFSRGEGCGVVVLKRLSDARADGDRILAVIRGSASNQDGRSGGLTVPNGPAQESVIRAALADGGLEPSDIDYVEAHGTGTSLGDPIEVRALSGALGAGRTHDGHPLLIGSVKTNIGHLESAAGIAGVIKVVLSLVHERIPPHLHFREPSPKIAWADYPVKVTAQGAAWERGPRVRRAGVSSFGFSGTNAHVILEEAPVEARGARLARPRHCLALSARTPAALAETARRWADALQDGGAGDFADVAHTAGVGRSHFPERLAVVAADASGARDALRAHLGGAEHPDVHRGHATPGAAPEVVFLFTGQGAQYPHMARALYETAPVFRDVIDRCDAQLGPDSQGRTLKSVIATDAGDASPIHETAWTQPALFAVEYGLAQLWRSWGIEPAAAIGHSLGEYVAACVAGVFTLEEGLALIAERARLMQSLPPGGSMAALFAERAEVERAVAGTGGRVAIAAVNAADSVVVSGEAAAVEALVAGFERLQVKGHRLHVSLAAHSPLVEPILDAMQAAAARVAMRAPSIPVAWNVTGGEALPGDGAPDAVYWRRHLREPVRFGDGIARLHADGYRIFLEVGPHPTLLALAQRTLPEEGTRLLPSLRRGKEDWSELLASVARLHVEGARIDFAALDAPYGLRPVAMPTYPFERREFWIAPSRPFERKAPRSNPARPLAMTRVPVALPVFEGMLAPHSPAWLEEHRVHGALLVAGPVLLEMVQSAASAEGAGPRAILDFAIREPLVLGEAGRVLQVHLGAPAGEARPFDVYSGAVDATAPGEWTWHATGRLGPGAPADGVPPEPLAALEARLGPLADCGSHYGKLRDLGIELGPAFQPLREARRRDGEALARIALPEALRAEAIQWAHPVLLDGALQAVGLAMPDDGARDRVHLFVGIEAIDLPQALSRACWAHVKLRSPDRPSPAEWRADVTLRGDAGEVLGRLRGVTLRQASRASLVRAFGGAKPAGDGLHYRVEWIPAPAGRRAATALVPPAHFAPEVARRFDALAAEHGLSIYAELLPQLDRLSGAHVQAAMRELRFEATPGRRFEGAAEARRLGVEPRHDRLFARLLDILAEDGVLAREGEGFTVVRAPAAAEPSGEYAALLARFSPVDGELRTLARCGVALARVLRGQEDPLQLLFPGGSFAEARSLYVDSPFARTYNGAIAAAVREALQRVPASSRLRVLEIGAGTGGTTGYVLPVLPADRVEYTFTDLSPLFLERARETFAGFDFVRHALLDIERDPGAQGFARERYDLVIAANVVHATADLAAALDHARDLLAPGGQLVLLEGVAPERWVDLTFGLTEGWWRFTDTPLRPAYPLIDRARWRSLLEQLGFDSVVVLPDGDDLARGPQQQAIVMARAPVAQRTFAIVGEGAVADALASRLAARGDRVMPSGAPLDAQAEPIYLGALALPAATVDAAACERFACTEPLRVLQRLVEHPGHGRAWLVTQGVHALQPGDAVARAQAPLWGVGRVFALEHPERWGALIDVAPGGGAEANAEAIIATLDAGDGEDQVAWRAGACHVARLRPAPAPGPARIALRPDRAYLVTGGFGGLGLVVGRWLAEQGARHVALMGRRPDPGSPGVAAIEAAGAQVTILAGDVADEARLDSLVAGLPCALGGIFHAAADLSSAPVAQLDAERVARMMRPKVAGTLALERVARERGAEFLALFSSTTALLGAAGFAHYAAANAFLDASAQAAAAGALRVLSVNWGTWETMRLASADDQRFFLQAGLLPIAVDEAMDALARLLATTASQVVVARMQWRALKALHESRLARPLLGELGTEEPGEGEPAATAAASGWAGRLAAVGPGERHDVLVDLVRGEVAAVLGAESADTVPLETGLFDLGMDSLMSVELKRRLERGAGRALPSTLTFNYPNVRALARFLGAQLEAHASPSSAPAPVAAAPAPEAPHADAELDELTDEELEARLLARLEQVR